MDPQNLSSRYGFITFRAHEAEPQVFEDFLTIFLPLLKTADHWAYTVEEDDSPARHIHAFISLTSTQNDKNKMDQKFGVTKTGGSKQMKDFVKSLKLKQTQWDHAYHSTFVPNEYHDVVKSLGYTMKSDVTEWRKSFHNISRDVINTAVAYYMSTARIEKSCVKNDWKQINAKNFHILCEHFAQQNDMTVHDYELIAKMTHARHTFNIPDKQMKKCLAELKFANKDYDPESREFLEINLFQSNHVDPSTEEDYKAKIKELQKNHHDEINNANKYQLELHTAKETIKRLKRQIKRMQGSV